MQTLLFLDVLIAFYVSGLCFMRRKKIEIWTPVYQFEELYEVSTLGRVRSLDRFFIDILNREHTNKGRILMPRLNRKKYLSIALYDINHKRTDKKIHAIVLHSFIGFSTMQINHKDLNKSNNRLDNLEYCTCRENIAHFWKSKKKSSQFIGVYFNKVNKINPWKASITVNGKNVHIGQFDKEIEAYEARIKYEQYLQSIGKLT